MQVWCGRSWGGFWVELTLGLISCCDRCARLSIRQSLYVCKHLARPCKQGWSTDETQQILRAACQVVPEMSTKGSDGTLPIEWRHVKL